MFSIISSMIMVALMIITLLVFARKSAATTKSNVFPFLMIGIGLLSLATYNAIHPHWWMVLVLAVIMVVLFFYLKNEQAKLISGSVIPPESEKKEINSALYMTISSLLISVGAFGMGEGHAFWWVLPIIGGVVMIILFIRTAVKDI